MILDGLITYSTHVILTNRTAIRKEGIVIKKQRCSRLPGMWTCSLTGEVPPDKLLSMTLIVKGKNGSPPSVELDPLGLWLRPTDSVEGSEHITLKKRNDKKS